MIKTLKQALDRKSPVNSYLRFFIKVSLEKCHNHSLESSQLCQEIHTDLVKEINRLVDQGITSTRDVKMLLDQHVQKKFSGESMPSRLSKAYFPEDSVIYTHVYRAVYSNKREKIDQEALQQTVNDWQNQNRDDFFFYRPYQDNPQGDVQTLLFCHQTKWQQQLLLRYGRICLLDATYKTTKYSLPLFFLAVKTNVGYSVTGTFVIQTESTSLIEEALNVFKKWLPDWQPEFWMTDFSEMEIGAIENTFQGSTVYLCSFHREQAWLRWVRKSGNVVTGHAEVILNIWRTIAASSDISEYESNVQKMNTSNIMQDNPKAVQYFCSQWLPESHRWVQAFSEKDYVTVINTNNGIESQNKVLKHSYLCHNSDTSLTGMLKTVVNIYVPDVYRKYCYKNSTFKMFNTDLPSYLQNRPRHFVKHVLTRISAARSDFKNDSITEISEGIFGVQSYTDKAKFYCVNFHDSSCTCFDFVSHRLPCKHMCAIFEFVPSWGFAQLNSAYINSPYITLDKDHGHCTVTEFTHSSTTTQNDQPDETQLIHPCEQNEQSQAVSTHQLHLPTTSCLASSQRHFRNAIKILFDMSYICTDEEFLNETTAILKEKCKEMENKISSSSGLPLRNSVPQLTTHISANKIKAKYRMLPLRRKQRKRGSTLNKHGMLMQ